MPQELNPPPGSPECRGALPKLGPVDKLEAIRAICSLRLSKYELLLLVCLTTLINGKSGLAWPSRKTLSASCGMPEASVRKTLRSLEAKGLTVIAESSTRRRSARYAINLNKIFADSEAQIATSAGATGLSQPELDGPVRGGCGEQKGGAPRLPEEELRMIEAQAKIRVNSSDEASPSPRRPLGRLAAAKPSSRERASGTNTWIEHYVRN